MRPDEGHAGHRGDHSGLHGAHGTHQGGRQRSDHGGHGHHGADHHDHHAHMMAEFKRRFWVSLAASAPVLALSPMIQSFLGYSAGFSGDQYMVFGISTFIYLYGGMPFLRGLYDEIGRRLPGMMTLIGVAISVAYVYSSLVVFGLRGTVFFWEIVTLIDVMLLGHWIEMRSVMGASKALEDLAGLLPSHAHIIDAEGSVRDVDVEDLKGGDVVLVKPGEKVPLDGEVVEGESEVNEAMITGESRPVPKGKGDALIGGSINGNGSLNLRVNASAQETYVSQVVKMVREAGESKSRAQGLADRAAFWLTVIAICTGTVTLFTWLAAGRAFAFALERMVTVMVITCPHALGLAVPLVIAMITAISARQGLLIRRRTQFEAARNLDVVVFDKTGTLTLGQFGVTDVVSVGGWDEADMLRRAAAVERDSEHSIGRCVVAEAAKRGLETTEVRDFKALPGKGAKAVVDGLAVYVGNSAILGEIGVEVGDAGKRMEDMASQGKTVVLVATESGLEGLIALEDVVREESREAVDRLKQRGIEVAMITGDNQATAAEVARNLGIDTFFAEVLPDEKSEKVKELQNRGKRVAMVGDGVNDAPALAQADLGIAIGAGTDIAVETADVVLVTNDPRRVLTVMALSDVTRRKTIQNLAWATGYNVVAIPLAAGVLWRYGIILPPAVGALVMSVSTVIVAVNARLISFAKA
jgi:Cu2+-exporting ATPase